MKLSDDLLDRLFEIYLNDEGLEDLLERFDVSSYDVFYVLFERGMITVEDIEEMIGYREDEYD